MKRKILCFAAFYVQMAYDFASAFEQFYPHRPNYKLPVKTNFVPFRSKNINVVMPMRSSSCQRPKMQFLALPACVNLLRTVSGYAVKEIELPIWNGLSVFAWEIADLKPLVFESVEKGTIRPHCAVSWPASQAVAYALSKILNETDSARRSHCRVFEIGAGNGVAGLCAATLGANVTSTDIHPLALELVLTIVLMLAAHRGSFLPLTRARHRHPLPPSNTT